MCVCLCLNQQARLVHTVLGPWCRYKSHSMLLAMSTPSKIGAAPSTLLPRHFPHHSCPYTHYFPIYFDDFPCQKPLVDVGIQLVTAPTWIRHRPSHHSGPHWGVAWSSPTRSVTQPLVGPVRSRWDEIPGDPTNGLHPRESLQHPEKTNETMAKSRKWLHVSWFMIYDSSTISILNMI